MEIILIIYLVVSIALIGIILLQQGKGAEMGASFGAGGANTVFGAAGSGNALTKTTTILAILFFATALAISYLNAEPEIIVDEVLDVTAPIESKGIESELPKTEAGLESQVAPAQPQATQEVKQAGDAKVEAAKVESETAVEKAKEAAKTQPEDDTK
ncbi:preprotein translocase subunit SecG [Aliikangiella sp. IMCC44653]